MRNETPLIAPFDAAFAERAQAAWARACGVRVRFTNTIDMEFVVIPPGEFLRGYSLKDVEQLERYGFSKEDVMQHRTMLTKPMFVGTYMVTQREYTILMGRNPSQFCPAGDLASHVEGLDTNRFPVDGVTWYDCIEACNALSERENLPPYYRFGPGMFRLESGMVHEAEVEIVGGYGYRLLTSAEWEFVYRGGTTTRYFYGDDRNQSPWLDAGHCPRAVGTDGPNNFGIFDLDSYYAEWCFDASSPDSYAKFVGRTAVDPVDLYDEGQERVMRGMDCCQRRSEPACTFGNSFSFRICRTITLE